MLPDNVYVWFTLVDEIQEEELLSEYRSILSTEELKKLERFRFTKHQKRFIVGRALVRTVIADFIGIKPEIVKFKTNGFGQPSLDLTNGQPQLKFSLSYTEGLVAVAIIVEQDIGIDIEKTDVEINFLDIALNYFSPIEAKDLLKLPEEHARPRFFQYWTLKESYLKAKGTGLTSALNEFSFTFEGHDQDQIILHPLEPGNRDRWMFKLLDLSPCHKGALCVSRDFVNSFEVSITKIVPSLK